MLFYVRRDVAAASADAAASASADGASDVAVEGAAGAMEVPEATGGSEVEAPQAVSAAVDSAVVQMEEGDSADTQPMDDDDDDGL